eukprot:scaffold88403_cov55-Attheya_sp.AAC.7
MEIDDGLSTHKKKKTSRRATVVANFSAKTKEASRVPLAFGSFLGSSPRSSVVDYMGSLITVAKASTMSETAPNATDAPTKDITESDDQVASEKKRSPSDFLKSVLGRPVSVRLNSGTDYRGT